MNSIRFTVPGRANPKGRPRVGRTHAGHAVMYTPKGTVVYESHVALFATEAMRGTEPLRGPVRVRMIEHRKRPSSARKRDTHPTTSPDTDNVVKSILDGCNAIVYPDDSAVVKLYAEKRFASDGLPRVDITVAPILTDMKPVPLSISAKRALEHIEALHRICGEWAESETLEDLRVAIAATGHASPIGSM